jgi:hypothetical protein
MGGRLAGIWRPIMQHSPIDDPAESFVTGVVVAPDDTTADHAAQVAVAAWPVPSKAKCRKAVN